jgi:hypothetical protein
VAWVNELDAINVVDHHGAGAFAPRGVLRPTVSFCRRVCHTAHVARHTIIIAGRTG